MEREELINKFKNGKDRYLKSSLMHSVVCSLITGCDPIIIIDDLITLIDDQSKKMEELYKKIPVQYIVKDKSVLKSLQTKPEGKEEEFYCYDEKHGGVTCLKQCKGCLNDEKPNKEQEGGKCKCGESKQACECILIRKQE